MERGFAADQGVAQCAGMHREASNSAPEKDASLMWTLPIKQARAGMILCVDIELAGRPFLQADSVVRLSDLRRHEELGIPTILVADHTSPAPAPTLAPALPSGGGLLSKKTRRAAFRVVRRQMERLKRGLPLESRPIFLAVEAILDEVLARSEAVLQ